MQGFEEGLRPLGVAAQRRGGVLVEEVPAPERDAFAKRPVRDRQPVDEPGDGLLELPDRFVLPFGGQVREARAQSEQREQGSYGREAPVPGAFDMLEADDLLERRGGEGGQIGGVEFGAGDGKRQVARMDQRGEQDRDPFRLQAQGFRRQIFDARRFPDEFGAVHDLPRPLLAQPVHYVAGVSGAGGVDAVAVEEFERVEDRCSLFRFRGPGDRSQGVLRRLGAVPGGDRHRKGGIVRRPVGEMGLQADSRHGVDQTAEVDALGGRQARKFAQGAPPGPFEQRLPAAPPGDLEGPVPVFVEPGGQFAEEARRLRIVCLFRPAGGCRGQVVGRRVAAQGFVKCFVGARQTEKDFVRRFRVFEARRLVGLDEIEIEVAGRRRGGAFVRRPEEQIAPARGLAGAPFDLVLPDPVAGDVCLVGAVQRLPQGSVIIAVEPRGVESLGPFLDEGVEVVGLPEIEIELAVLRVGRDELAAHRLVDFPEHRFHLRQQVVGGVAAELSDPRLIEAETVAELPGGGAQGGADVPDRQPVHRQGVNDAQRHRLVGRARIGLFDERLEHPTALDDGLDVGDGAEGRVFAQFGPVAVISDQTGAVGGDVAAQQALHRERQGAEDLALLGHGHPLERVDIIRVHREQVDIFVHALVHAPVEAGEGLDIVADTGPLFAGLAEQALGDDELHVAARDADLLEAVLHAADAVGGEGEAVAVENGFLHAGDEAEAEVLADFAHLAQEAEIEDQLVVVTRAQIVQQFVDDEQQTMVGVDGMKRRHCVLEGALAAGGFADAREGKGDAEGGQALLELAGHDVAERHGGGADLGADDLEPAGDGLRRLRRFRVREFRRQPGMFGDRGDRRHQMRLAGAVIADDQDTLVVGGPVVAELGEDQVRQPLGHVVGDDIASHQAPGRFRLVGVAQLHHRLDGVETDRVVVFHRPASASSIANGVSATG